MQMRAGAYRLSQRVGRARLRMGLGVRGGFRGIFAWLNRDAIDVEGSQVSGR